MNNYKYAYITYGLAWLSTAVAVSVAVYITKSVSPLWAFLIPACIKVTHKDDSK